MTDEQLRIPVPPDGYGLEITRQRNGWRVVVRTHDPSAGRWRPDLELGGLTWSEAVEASYTSLWGFRPD